ncbi:MAG: glycosyltransferase [Microthrixaceae bacterium]
MTPLRRTRVLMMTDALSVGGAERVAVDIANTLDPQQFDARFCATRDDGPLHARIHERIPVTILGRAATWDLPKLLAFAAQVRAEGIDLIHSHGRGTLKFVALTQALGLIDVKHVYHDHYGWLHIDRGADPGLRRALRAHVDAFIGVDTRLCDWAVSTAGVDPDRVHLVRSGVDIDRFDDLRPVDLRQRLGLPQDSFVLMMVANFRPPKDHPTLFRAIAELPEDLRARLHLVISGTTTADPEYHRNCMAMAERLGIRDQVHDIGEQDDVPELLAGADAAVLSSKNETGPLVILEYMAAGLPFLATDTGEIAAAVRDLGVGYIRPPRDHYEVADGLAALIRATPSERREMGSRGRDIARSQFSQALATARIEAIYRDVLALQGAPQTV